MPPAAYPFLLSLRLELEPWELVRESVQPPQNGRLEELHFTGDVAGVELRLLNIGFRRLVFGDYVRLEPLQRFAFHRNAIVVTPGFGGLIELRNPSARRRRCCVTFHFTGLENSMAFETRDPFESRDDDDDDEGGNDG